MANEISNMTLAASPARPVKDSGQFTKLDGAPAADAGKLLPIEGKDLPQQSGNEVELQDAVNQINDYVQTVQRDLSFSMNSESGKTVIKVIDTGSGELIRQIPSEEVLALATYLNEVREEAGSPGEVSEGLLFSDST